MSKIERTNIMLDVLKMMHQVNEFAEKKHAILFAVNVASMFAIIHQKCPSSGPRWSVFAIVLSLALSLLSQVLALYPVLNMKSKCKSIEGPANVFNLVHLGESEKTLLLDKITILTPNSSFNELDAHLAEQIVVVARIASRKFHWFKTAAVFTVSSFVGYVFIFVLQ